MIEFIEAVSRHSFLQYALLAGALASVACGIMGSYVVTRRITYIAGAIAHSVLGGMGAAYYFSVVYEWLWLKPIHGAVVAALLAAILIGWVTLHAREREDTAIGAIWAIGMAIGIIFISQTPGYNQELMSYLFGNILMISPYDLWLILALDLLIAVTTIIFYNKFLAICFDEEFARVRGIRVDLYYLLLLCLTALTVVILVAVVGVIMVIALLTLPAAAAGYFSHTLRKLMVVAVGCSILFTTSGLALSYQTNLPAGATIIIVAGVAYLVVAIGSWLLMAVRRNFIRARKQKADGSGFRMFSSCDAAIQPINMPLQMIRARVSPFSDPPFGLSFSRRVGACLPPKKRVTQGHPLREVSRSGKDGRFDAKSQCQTAGRLTYKLWAWHRWWATIEHVIHKVD